MSKIIAGALGGLGEKGKNMYVVEVDQDIFILDAGIKYPSVELLGIDTIIPDFSYLVENKNRIRGLFITHCHIEHIGAIPHLLKEIDVPIYGTSFTNALISDLLLENDYKLDDVKLITVNNNTTLKFQSSSVSFFATTHNIPESIAIVIETKDGSIVYTGNYTFDQNVDKKYQTNFARLNEVAKKKVLCLMTESYGADQFGNPAHHYELMHKLNGVFSNASGRIIVSLFSSDLLRIQKVIDLAISYQKKIAIIGRKTQRIVDVAVKLGYLEIPKDVLVNLRYIDEKNDNLDDNLVVLVTGDRHEPFFMLQRMCKKIDRLIHVSESDNVIILTLPIQGTEKMSARTLDVLYRTGAKVTLFDKSKLPISHATSEEVKMMINILKPKYIFPVIGEYRHQYYVRKIALEMGYNDENIIMGDLGNGFVFNNKVLDGAIADLKANEVLIDGSMAGDVNDVVLRDRELLSEDGVLLIVANISPKTKKVLSGPEIVSKGFVHIKDMEHINNDIKTIFDNVVSKYLVNKYINWADLKNDLKTEVNKYLYKETKRNPITIPVIISTDLPEN